MTLGRRIHELRKASGLSQEQLANHINVSRQTISNWEGDIGTPSLEKIVLISDLFQVSLDQLVKGEMPKSCHEVNLDELVQMNWQHRKKMLAFIIGVVLFVLGIVTYILVDAIDAVGYGLGYMLYRYIVVEEYAYAGIESTIAMSGIMIFIISGIVILSVVCFQDIKKIIKKMIKK